MERIWIYTLSQQLPQEQLALIKQRCQEFVNSWTAHEVSLDASFDLYRDRLLMFKVNEAHYNASGCSIDKQLRLVKELEQQFGIELLNRLLVAYEQGGEVKVVKSSAIPALLQEGAIHENTLVFDNTITQSDQLDTHWKRPLKDTYLSRYLSAKTLS